MSGDQTEANQHSFCLKIDLTEDLVLTGFASVFLQIQSAEKFAIAFRLCDENPETEESTLIYFAVKNLGDLMANQTNLIQIQLKATTYKIPKEHQISLCFSPAMFPIMFPLRTNVGTLTIFPRTLQFLVESPKSEEIFAFPKPNPLLQFPKEYISLPNLKRWVDIDLINNNAVKFNKNFDTGHTYSPLNGLDFQEKDADSLETDFKVNQATIMASRQISIKYPAYGVDVLIETNSKFWADDEFFYTEDFANIFLNDEEFFAKNWTDKIERNFA